MAKESTSKKAKSAKFGDGVKIKVKVDKKANAKKGGAKKNGKSKSDYNPIEALSRLAESPIVAELIAAGAAAAVASLANRTDKGNHAKKAGKAAAAAIGARLMTEFNAVKDSAKAAVVKDKAGKA